MTFQSKFSARSPFTLASLCALALAGCGGGGSSIGGTIEALSMADSMAVVTTNSNGSGSSVAPGAQADTTGFSPTCAYNTDVAQAHVYDPSMEPLGTVNMILCLLKQTAYAELLNEGLYKAQIDELSCDNGNQGGGSSSGTGQSSGTQQSFNIWVIESSRSSNTGAHNVEFWIPPTDSEGNEIRVRVAITQGVSPENPFGVFELNYIEYESDHVTIRGLGNLSTLDVLDGFIGFSFYQEHGDVDVVQSSGHHAERVQANVNMFADQSQGVARILLASRENQGGGGDTGIQTHEYLIAFDDAHVLRSTDGAPGVCLSRTDYSTKTWRYNLYDANDGSRVELNSGFGFQTTTGDYGWVGYYGLWTNPDVTLETGDTVTRNTFGNSTGQTYTVLKAPGKLVKNSRHTLALTQLADETFEWWHNTSGGGPQTFVRERLAYDGMHWIATALYDEQSQTWSEYSSPIVIDVAGVGFLGMWSESLGGQCSFVNGAESITYFTRENVGPDNSLFTSANNVELYGLFQCLRTGITTQEANAGDVFFQNSFDLQTPYEYRIHKDDMSFTRVTGGGQTVVGLADGEAPTSGPYTWGMNSGPMVISSDYDDLQSPNDIWLVPVFYTYETGPNSWNQFAMLRDANGAPVSFDKPIQFSYTHHTADDANESSANDGRTFLFSYNGPGELGGIPQTGYDFDGDTVPDRWYPQFSILDGTLCGPNGTEYVIRAMESEQTLVGDPGNCSALNIGPVGVLQLPSVTDWVDPQMGLSPTIEDAPRVIKGEVVGSGN